MNQYIIHANQTVGVRSTRGLWPPETLRSKPTFSIKAESLDAALAKASDDVRKRYTNDAQTVDFVEITAALVREIPIP